MPGHFSTPVLQLGIKFVLNYEFWPLRNVCCYIWVIRAANVKGRGGACNFSISNCHWYKLWSREDFGGNSRQDPKPGCLHNSMVSYPSKNLCCLCLSRWEFDMEFYLIDRRYSVRIWVVTQKKEDSFSSCLLSSVVLAIWVSWTRRVVLTSGNLKSCSKFVAIFSCWPQLIVHPNSTVRILMCFFLFVSLVRWKQSEEDFIIST